MSISLLQTYLTLLHAPLVLWTACFTIFGSMTPRQSQLDSSLPEDRLEVGVDLLYGTSVVAVQKMLVLIAIAGGMPSLLNP